MELARDEDAPLRFTVPPSEAGLRLDVWLHTKLQGHSRSWVKDLVVAGVVWVDAQVQKPSHRLQAGQTVTCVLKERAPAHPLAPQPIPLNILHEDASLLVIDKPPGLVVHPGNGRADGTLANALAYYIGQLSDVGGSDRPGIVHRLDRDTSGVMVVAKTNRAHYALAAQFQERTTEKEYVAVVEGEVALDGDRIQAPLGRHRVDLAKVVVDERDGKPAMTDYTVLERFRGFTSVRCRPKTGRTHQIRVHLAHIGSPILCDPTYGRRRELHEHELAPEWSGEPKLLLGRHALHAHTLTFDHPLEGKRMSFSAPLPTDFETVLDALRRHRARSSPTRRSS